MALPDGIVVFDRAADRVVGPFLSRHAAGEWIAGYVGRYGGREADYWITVMAAPDA